MEINFSKYSDGLVPAVVQDNQTGKVLMLGFMNQEAVDKTKIAWESDFLQQVEKKTVDKRRRKRAFSNF